MISLETASVIASNVSPAREAARTYNKVMLAYEELHQTHARIHREAQEAQRMAHEHHEGAREAHERHKRNHAAFDAINQPPRPAMGWSRRRTWLDSLLTLEFD
ncbi:hypothetical protein [Bradyrhizobium sp. CCGUVB14]|uniref:hypothetical protein n=1 Tax=Bradyrhizobium sp. CCGUVB14 TaxID=2949628 RepID=UPI0020B18E0E|nr:hypothetical protein [Bradyrhizobium sp. CCGUVB14]MCP3447329.1 hypothetical protein [Bradyrhizobium sp. CCGUVB14]